MPDLKPESPLAPEHWYERPPAANFVHPIASVPRMADYDFSEELHGLARMNEKLGPKGRALVGAVGLAGIVTIALVTGDIR